MCSRTGTLCIEHKHENFKINPMTTSTAIAITGNFIQRIPTQKGPLDFSFLRKTSVLSDKYFVLAMDTNLKPIWFSMEVRNDKWVIIDTLKVPKWISNVEDQLSEMIVLHNLI